MKYLKRFNESSEELSYNKDLIETLKEMFGNQKDAAGKEIDEYIGKQREAMNREKSRFQELASKCTAAAETSAQNIARANKDNQR